jgi:hypothetical protein
MALPKNKAALEIGDAIKASRQSFGRSRAKLRLTTSAPAKANTSHNNPPDISSNASDVGSKAKLNRSRITTAKESEAFNVSFVRISDRKSFHATVIV